MNNSSFFANLSERSYLYNVVDLSSGTPVILCTRWRSPNEAAELDHACWLKGKDVRHVFAENPVTWL